MSGEEFTETPYAASFGPVPVSYRPPEPGQNSTGDEESAPDSDALPKIVEPVKPLQPPQLAPVVQPPRANVRQKNQVPDMDEIIMDENLAQSLAAATRLNNIDLHESTEWDDTVGIVANGLRSIQTRWSILEAERKRLAKPVNTTASPITRGVRRRGRGRGRRRGRWRAI